MTDRRLRELARTAATGDQGAAAQLLRERVRAGELLEEQVRLAAHLGDAAARACVPGLPMELAPLGTWKFFEEEFDRWLNAIPDLATWSTGGELECGGCSGRGYRGRKECLGCLGEGRVPEVAAREIMVRCAVAAARMLLSLEMARCGDVGSYLCVDHQRTWDALDAAEAWLACPCEKHRQASVSTDHAGQPEWADVGTLLLDPPTASLHYKETQFRRKVQAVARIASESATRTAISAALISWCLA